MKCLKIDQIYLYLEKELNSDEIRNIETHLTSCEKCQNAVYERDIFLQAAENLPVLEPPHDFSHQVMMKILPRRIPLRIWIRVTAAGFSAATLALFIFFLFSGQNVLNLLIHFNQMLIGYGRSISIFFVKSLKLIFLFTDTLSQLVRLLFKSLTHLTTILNPEVQIILITFTFVATIFLFFGVKRKLLTGEKI